MVLRHRKPTNVQETVQNVVQELDAFVKVEEHYVEQSLLGAVVYIVTWILAIALIYIEFWYFFNPDHTFKFVPDKEFSGYVDINVDLTVAMPCETIGADILDSTYQNTFSFGRLKEEPTWFELDRLQRKHFDSIKTFNEYLREEYHSLQDLLWNSGQSSLFGELPKRRTEPNEPYDACRIHGVMSLNKVEGNFHITAGKSVPLLRGHAHLSGFMDEKEYNFTHRIDQFGFGKPHAGIVHPLAGDEKIASKNYMNYQYFIQIVPTDIQTLIGSWPTFQYSVKEQAREVGSYAVGSSGIPGIYFKYDISAFKVIVNQDRESIWQFLLKLCSGVGGIFATSQIICDVLRNLISFCVTNHKKEEKEEKDVANFLSNSST